MYQELNVLKSNTYFIGRFGSLRVLFMFCSSHVVVGINYFFKIIFRLWKDVTSALKKDDLEAATAAKHKVQNALLLKYIIVIHEPHLVLVCT